MNLSNPNVKHSHSRIILAGMMGSGKTTLAKLLSSYLDWEFIDTDQVIEKRNSKTIREIFAQEGESYFRDLEKELAIELQSKEHCVIATGGGMVVSEENRKILSQRALVVHLHSSTGELIKRLQGVKNRPLLLRGELHEQLQTIYKSRASVYEGLPAQIFTDGKKPIQIVQEILFQLLESHNIISSSKYNVHVGLNLSSKLASILNEGSFSSPVFILADKTVWDLTGEFYINQVKKQVVRELDFEPIVFLSTEQNKTMDAAISLWKKMIQKGADRASCVVVMGGGVLGDVGGFVASTLFRGIALIQIPTTLLAQIDSAIGGKTGVNLDETKNMVGTFYPANHTLIDPIFLLTLPEREIRSGFSEMIKTGMLGDAELFEFLEAESLSILNSRIDLLLKAVEWTAKIKVDIVEEDLFEKSGRRILLNFGHTFGHAIEVLSNYELKHGEAVSIGMVLATKLAHHLNYCEKETLDRLIELLKNARLPVEMPKFSKNAILAKMKRDKKRTNQILRFVFPRKIGTAEAIPVDKETLRLALE